MTSSNDTKEADASPSARLTIFTSYLGLVKDALEIFWKLAPFTLVFSGGMLLFFLKQCGWSELFAESALSVSGLSYIVIAGALAAVAIVFLFVIPSVMMVGINFSGAPAPLLTSTAVPLYLAAYFGWVVALAVGVTMDSSSTMMLLGAPAFAVVMMGYLLITGHSKTYPGIDSKWGMVGRAVEASSMVMLNSFGLLMLIRLAPVAGGEGVVVTILFIIALAVTSALGIAPGLLYLRLRAKSDGYVEPLKGASVGILLVGVIVLYPTLSFLPVAKGVFEVAGIFSDEEARFQLVDDELKPALINAGLQLDATPQGDVVKGYVRYSRGGVRLVCKEPLGKGAPSEWWKRPSEGQLTAMRLKAGSHCVKTTLTELRRFTP